MHKKIFVFAICLATIAWAATKPDFSGNYAAQQKKSDKAITVSLRVVQTESAVEVTRIYGDKSLTNRFPLDGSEGDYTTETGVRGKCRAATERQCPCTGIVGGFAPEREYTVSPLRHYRRVATLC